MIVQYSALAITVVLCLFLFLSMKREIRGIEARYLRNNESVRAEVRQLEEELGEMRKELELMDGRPDATAIGRTLGPGVRTQALRMIKHGEGPEHIAAALSLPRTEVELLIKLQRLMTEQPVEVTA